MLHGGDNLVGVERHVLGSAGLQIFELTSPRIELATAGNDRKSEAATVGVLQLCGQLGRIWVELATRTPFAKLSCQTQEKV